MTPKKFIIIATIIPLLYLLDLLLKSPIGSYIGFYIGLIITSTMAFHLFYLILKDASSIKVDKERMFKKMFYEVSFILSEDDPNKEKVSLDEFQDTFFKNIPFDQSYIIKTINKSKENQLYHFWFNYKKELIKDYKIFVTKDKYGIVNHKKWDTKIKNIVEHKVWPQHVITIEKIIKYVTCVRKYDAKKFRSYIYQNENEQILQLASYITEQIEIEIDRAIDNIQVELWKDNMNGQDYEYFLAHLISSKLPGWSAEVSKASGDQGVDLVVTSPSKLTVAIQAKCYSSPVGNKAVQEVSAGKLYYNTDFAIVVTNSTFTKSAEELAEKTGVMLTHHTTLIDLLCDIDRARLLE